GLFFKMHRSSVLVGSPVSLPCVFERRTEPLDRGALTVEWNVVDRRGDKSIVYTFEDGGARPSRGDCAVDARRLLLGDASLLLHNVTVADEGLYTCRVLGASCSHVWVSAARPSVSLPERVEVTDGEERTIQCAVSAYYPEKLAVTWHVANGSHTLGAGLGRSARVCTELATRNPDGTFSIRSGVTSLLGWIIVVPGRSSWITVEPDRISVDPGWIQAEADLSCVSLQLHPSQPTVLALWSPSRRSSACCWPPL
uniref:Ig-like domain-containing protein n=1 Tax=Salarias fasciatus TaxID=181472 RepID=A0A672ITF9_SALFA